MTNDFKNAPKPHTNLKNELNPSEVRNTLIPKLVNPPPVDKTTKNIDRIANRGNGKIKYSILKNEFVSDRDITLAELRDKHYLTYNQYSYLHNLKKLQGWDKLRLDFNTKVNREVIGDVVDTRVNEIKSLNVLIKNICDRIDKMSSMFKFRNTQELMNVMDMTIKLRELLKGNATDKIDINTTHKTIQMILKKLN